MNDLLQSIANRQKDAGHLNALEAKGYWPEADRAAL